jgi:hypothetical protein
MTARFHTWDRLPLFADEEAISGALMGPGKTAEWRQIAPLLERRGLPTVDGLMGGRYIPALKAFSIGSTISTVRAKYRPRTHQQSWDHGRRKAARPEMEIRR